MSKKIETYQELLDEKVRLQLLLSDQRRILREDINQIKEQMAPVKKAISVVGKFATRDYSNWMLTTASDTVIDLFLRKTLLAKAGWFTKFLVPFLMKNFSSHVVADNKKKLIRKLFSWIGSKNANGKMHHAEPQKTGPVDDEQED